MSLSFFSGNIKKTWKSECVHLPRIACKCAHIFGVSKYRFKKYGKLDKQLPFYSRRVYKIHEVRSLIVCAYSRYGSLKRHKFWQELNSLSFFTSLSVSNKIIIKVNGAQFYLRLENMVIIFKLIWFPDVTWSKLI